MKQWQERLAMIIIGFLAGIGTMLITVVGNVRENAVKISYVEAAQVTSDKNNALRVERIVKLWEASLEADREMLSMVKQLIFMYHDKHNL